MELPTAAEARRLSADDGWERVLESVARSVRYECDCGRRQWRATVGGELRRHAAALAELLGRLGYEVEFGDELRVRW